MRVVFMGTPDFAVPSLQAVVDAGHDVVLVVSQPDRPVGRGQEMRSPAVVQRARDLDLEVAQPRALRSGPFPKRFAELAPDVLVVVAYGRILSGHYLDTPTHGAVNVHASLLPRWRGAAPIQAALLAGDEVTGVCTQRMALELDTGPVYLSRQVRIGSRETAGALHDRLAGLGAEVLTETLARLPDLEPVEQDHDQATWCSKIDRDDGRLDLSGEAEGLDRQIRAMTPWPGAWLPWTGGPLKIKQAHPVPGEGAPGEVLSTDPLVVACGGGALAWDRVQEPGRRVVGGRDFANGQRLSVGDVLAFPPEA